MSLSCLPRQTLSEQQRTRHSSYCLDRSIHRSTGIAGCLQQKISRAVPLCSAQQGYCRSHRRRLSVRSAEAFDRPVYADPRLPTQGEAVVRGPDRQAGLQLEERPADVDYLAELIALKDDGPKDIGFFGTRNMGLLHQNLIEVLSYAMVLTDNHIFTSGATGTNAAVIRGALRAEKPHLLTVVLPQSRGCQPPESQELLQEVHNVIEMPQNDRLPLLEASRMCNRDIVGRVKQILCFAFHDSRLLLETCQEAHAARKMVTLFYLD